MLAFGAARLCVWLNTPIPWMLGPLLATALVSVFGAPTASWIPLRNGGQWVIGDRHDLSTQAYQGGGRGIDRTMLATLRDAVLGDFRPNLTLYLDVTPEVGLQRARARGELDRIEQESMNFFNRTRARYLELAAADPSIRTVDATQPLDAVARDIRATIAQWMAEQAA